MDPFAIFAVPAHLKDAANAELAAMGWGDGNLGTPLSACDAAGQSVGPVTHWASFATATPRVRDLLASPPAGSETLAAAVLFAVNAPDPDLPDDAQTHDPDDRAWALAQLRRWGLAIMPEVAG